MTKDQSSSINSGKGVRQSAGYPWAGAAVYFVLPEGSANAGKVRAAVVTRMYQSEERSAQGTLPEDVDLDVSVRSEDGIGREQTKVAHSAVGVREMGTWCWQDPQESGF